MRILIDEDTAVQLVDPLRCVLVGHDVAHVAGLSWKGKKDRHVLPDAKQAGFQILITRIEPSSPIHANATRSRSRACIMSATHSAMDAILTELEVSIQEALDDTQRWEQASLFEIEAERDQLHADRDALHRRLTSIPAMREQETDALRRRYADPQSCWFPAAITFLVPASIAKGGTV
jgi:hypothetical protein